MSWKLFGFRLQQPRPVLPQGVSHGDPSMRGTSRTQEQREAQFEFEERWLRASGQITGPLANQGMAPHEPPGGNRIWTSPSDRCPNCGAPSQEVASGLRVCIMRNCGVHFVKEG